MAGAVARWWFSPLPLARVAVFRILVYLFIPADVLYFRSSGAAHGSVEGDLYVPLEIGRILPLPTPSTALVMTLHITLVVLPIALVVLGIWDRLPRWQTFFASVVAVAYLEWLIVAFSYGKVDHDRFAFIAALFVLPTVGRASLRDHRDSQAAGWALRFVQIGAVLTYFFAAWAKVRFGGWGWVNSATILRSVIRRGTALADPLMDHPWTLVFTQWFILAIEFASPVLLFVRAKWQYLIVAGLLMFHLMTYAMITIIFLPHVLCLTSFLPLERLVPARLRVQPIPDPVAAP